MELSNKLAIGQQIEIRSTNSIEADIRNHFPDYIPKKSEYFGEKNFPLGQLTKYGFIDITFVLRVSRKQDIYKFAMNMGYYFLPESLIFKKNSEIIWNSDPEKMIPYSNEQLERLIELSELKNNQLFFRLLLSSLDYKLNDDRNKGIFNAKEQFKNQFADLVKYFPMKFVVTDACISNSEYIWSEKYFYC